MVNILSERLLDFVPGTSADLRTKSIQAWRLNVAACAATLSARDDSTARKRPFEEIMEQGSDRIYKAICTTARARSLSPDKLRASYSTPTNDIPPDYLNSFQAELPTHVTNVEDEDDYVANAPGFIYGNPLGSSRSDPYFSSRHSVSYRTTRSASSATSTNLTRPTRSVSPDKPSPKEKRALLTRNTIPSVTFGLRPVNMALPAQTSQSLEGRPAYLSKYGVKVFGKSLCNSPIPVQKPPGTIVSLIKRFSVHRAAKGCIPSSWREWASEVSFIDDFEDGHFDHHEGWNPRLNRDFVLEILNKTYELVAANETEEKWYPMVERILGENPEVTAIPEITTNTVTQVPIINKLLPRKKLAASWDTFLPGDSISTAKVDLLMSYNPAHPDMSICMDQLRHASSDAAHRADAEPLTFLADTNYDNHLAIAPVEVKTLSNGYALAAYQLAVASCAMLRRLSGITGGNAELQDPIPVVGWTVVGHDWKLHVAYYSSSGVMLAGPYDSGGTSSLLSLMKLLSIIREVKKWAMEEFIMRISDYVYNENHVQTE